MIGQLIEKLFVQVRADMSDLSRDLSKGVAATNSATSQMVMSWNQVSKQVNKLTMDMKKGDMAAGAYTSEMNKLASTMKGVAGSYRDAQRQVWGYASAAHASAKASAAIDHRPIALVARSTGQARMQMMNLGYQINDIGMTLATGMNPMTVLIQQGSQILQIYAGQGGVRAAFSDISKMLVGIGKRVWPLALIAGGLKGVQYEINKTTEETVTFGDTALATWQYIRDGVVEILRPVTSKLTEWFVIAWNEIVSTGKQMVNNLISAVRVLVLGVKTAVTSIPGLFRRAWYSAVAQAQEALYKLGTQFERFMGGVATTMNEVFGTSFDENPVYDWVSGFEAARHEAQKLADTTDSLSDVFDDFKKRAEEIAGEDVLGGIFDEIKSRAIENSLNRVKEDVKKTGKEIKDELTKLADDIEEGILGGVEEFLLSTDKFKDAFTDLVTHLVREAYKLLVVQPILDSISGILRGGKGGNSGGGLLGGLLRSIGIFEGGGRTGNGARSGGLDGRGGMLAMVHPRERIIDEHKGQSVGGAGVVINQYNSFEQGVSASDLQAMLPKLRDDTKNAVFDALQRGEAPV